MLTSLSVWGVCEASPSSERGLMAGEEETEDAEEEEEGDSKRGEVTGEAMVRSMGEVAVIAGMSGEKWTAGQSTTVEYIAFLSYAVVALEKD